VLDLGSGTVKALVVSNEGGALRVRGAAAVPGPSPDDAGSGEALLAACERALVAAEDAAGAVPVRVFVGLTPQRGVVTQGTAAGERQGAGSAPTPEELAPLVARAERQALERARQRLASEFATPTRPHPLNATVSALTVDGQPIASLAEAVGKRVELRLAAAFAPEASVSAATELADRLDLELGGLLLTPFAVAGALAAAGLGPAVVVDAGTTLTAVSVVGDRWVEAAATFPLGGSALNHRLAAEAGVSPAEAQEAIVAHCAGAGGRSRSGAAVGRIVSQLARHHAEVWVDALSAACGSFGRDGDLPASVVLTGGGSSLPEITELLAQTPWHAGLPFTMPPSVHRPLPRDLAQIRGEAGRLPVGQAVPVLCLAAVATGAYTPPTPFDGLLRTAGIRPRGRDR